ncbi:MAG TPA: cytochrome c oxidase subunit II [Rhizomicrobium sp.]|jgi:cytochrome c oxidase subunit 2
MGPKLAAGAFLALLTMTGGASALPENWGTTFQPPVTPVMDQIESFHKMVLYIIIAVCVFVLALLVWIVIRYNSRANPVPSQVSHNTVLEVMWTLIPVIILVIIAIPSFKLLYYEMTIPKADMTLRAIGKQWFWTYEYPVPGGKFQFDSLGLSDDKAKAAGEPRLLGVDNPVYVPVNKNVVVQTTGADVIHSWAVPQFGVKMDAVPGRINTTWFKATQTGTYYGECSELCGARHAFMPIEVKVVSQADYDTWLAASKKKYAFTGDATKLASK